jgi:hypothetical protein
MLVFYVRVSISFPRCVFVKPGIKKLKRLQEAGWELKLVSLCVTVTQDEVVKQQQ